MGNDVVRVGLKIQSSVAFTFPLMSESLIFFPLITFSLVTYLLGKQDSYPFTFYLIACDY